MNITRRVSAILLSVAIAGLTYSSAWANDGGAQKESDACSAKSGCDQKNACGQKGGRCHDCGCLSGCCNKVCRLTTKPKKVKVTCYKSECDTICLPPPSHRGCRHCEMVDCEGDKDGDGKCDSKGCGSACANQKKVVWFDWDVDTKGKGEGCCEGRGGHAKKLYKKEIEVELKGVFEYKWEVVDLCKGCEQKSIDEAPADAPGGEVPPPPPVAARVIPAQPLVDRMATRSE